MMMAGERARWLVPVAMALVLAGAALAIGQWKRVPPAPAAPDTSEAAIGQALTLAPVDSVAYKSRWLDEVRGLEYEDLDATKRELFLRHANAQRCECGCGYTLAACLASDMTCEESRPRAQALLDSVRAGRIATAAGLRARPD